MESNSKFSDGFLWGLLIGGGVVFLLGTKKGNEILRLITEEGAEKINQAIEEIKSEIDDANDEVVPDTSKKKDLKDGNFHKTMDNLVEIEHDVKDEIEEKVKPQIKRFFKTTKKNIL